MRVPVLGALTKDPHGCLVSEPHSIAAFGGRACRFELEGYEDDPHPEDFIEAVKNILEATESIISAATSHVHQYCADMQGLYGDEAPHLEVRRPEDVWRYVTFGSYLTVSRDHGDKRDVFLSMECNCDWEVEHGLQLVFRNGREISKVGPFDGHLSNESAYGDTRLRGVVYKRISG